MAIASPYVPTPPGAERWGTMGRSAPAGARLALVADPSIRLTFKGYGHRGRVIATWDRRPPGCPSDCIGRQKDFYRLIEETTP